MTRVSIPLALAVLAIAWLGVQAPARAAQLQPIGSFTNPVFVTSDPSDAERLFVVEQGGRIELTVGGTTTTFLDATGLSSPGIASGGEQGLLSMAFATDYATSGLFYVFYTGTDSGALHVDQFMASGDTASAGTRKQVITVPHPSFNNHNAGQLQVGPDGYLYVSTGDGGSGGDPGENAQNPSSLLGKILRIAPDSEGGYDTPQDNPFGNEVWSYGLRNPFRFSFDRLTGDLLIGDVGQAAWEEVDFEPVAAGAGRGDNFGWDCYEGRHVFELTPDCPAIGATTQPILEYPNPNGGANPSSAVNGGYVIRDPTVCELYGRYVYADTYAGQLRSLIPALPDAIDDRPEGIPVPFTTSFGEDASGRVYVASNGSVYRIVHTPGAECATPPSAPAPFADSTAPGLTLNASKQTIAGRTVEVTAGVDEQAIVSVDAAVRKGKKGKVLFELPRQAVAIEAGSDEQLSFGLERRQAQRLRRLIHRGRRVEVHFTGSATDAAGNHGADVVARARLRA